MTSGSTGRAAARPWNRYYENPGGVPVINFDRNDIPYMESCADKKAQMKLNIQVKFNQNKATSTFI